MLDSLRRGAKTLVAKLLLGLLVVSFAIWGIADVFRVNSARSVAEVGDTPIDAATFQRVYTRQVQQLSQQFGQPVDAEMASAIGVPQRVLGQLMTEATLTDAARAFGLGVSDVQLAKEISEDPNLRPEGASDFDRGYFNRLLRDNGLTEPQYIEDRRLNAVRRQLADGLVGGTTAPKALLEALHRYRSEVRSIDYVALSRAQVEPVPAPTDADLATWYEKRKSGFEAPEFRTVRVLAVTPDALADPASVSDEDARKEYDRNRGGYTEPERRRIQQLLFPTVEEAKAASDRIKGGASFETVVTERGMKPEDVDLGLVTREAVVDKTIADNAFTLAPNVVSEPIKARFGGALVRVTEIVPESVKPFEEVAAAIKADVARRNGETAVLETHDEIEDARAGGATLTEIAQRFKLKDVVIETDAKGNGPDGKPVAELPELPKIIDAAFKTEEGSDNDPVQVGSRGFAWYAVEKVTPARDRPLDEVRDQVVAAWTDEKAAELLSKKAADMAAAVKGGQDLAAQASGAGVTVQKAENFTRHAAPPEVGDAVAEAAFVGPEGTVGTATAPDGREIVFKVTKSIVPPFFAEEADSVEAARRFRDELQNSLLSLYVDHRQQTIGTSVNQQTLQSIIGTPSN